MYSPEKKVVLLLRVCKLIYTVMENNSGRLYGADDFLPVLTYALAQGDTLELDTETEYMVELLDPSLLHGEELPSCCIPGSSQCVYRKDLTIPGKAEGSVAGEEWHGHVTALSVAPEFQQLGLAAKLMELLGEISEVVDFSSISL
ncbi:N-terminal acetyltransferase complex ARD1 subunit homolog [Falco peregrinus]|uniref:N-terminal acetyltransferase complex ARD1 subunit homolog n=1 Tax=Falco peregrinus TaxID=8954 RepID=UPI002478516F|nr:N-terminal acetyltransferase complex ARD1 subunit homolog [Falco peregrinus]